MKRIHYKTGLLTLTIGSLTLAVVSTVAVSKLPIAKAAFGQDVISPLAHAGKGGGWGAAVSSGARP